MVKDMDRRNIGWSLVGLQIALFVVLALLPWRAPSVASLIAAIPVLALGLWLAVASFSSLGSALTPTPVPVVGAGLRTTGPYARVRHPIYTSVLLLVLAAVIFAGTWWSWGWSLVILTFLWLKSRWEDRLLAQEYGEQWLQWAQRTGALIPRRKRRAP